MIKRIIKRINKMSFCSKKNNIFYLLSFWINFYYVSRKYISWITFISYHKLIFFYSHGNYLIVDSRIIEISTQKEKDEYTSNNIIIEEWKNKNTCKYYSKYQVPYFTPLKFFSVIDENTHIVLLKIKIQNYQKILYSIYANLQDLKAL